MNLPSDTPRLPKWIFLTGDAILLGTAGYIAANSPNAMSGTPLIAIVCCVAAACILGAIPFAADYARRQDEALDSRQRALQALAATIGSSAEQISIAAASLHALTGIVQDNITQSEVVAQQIKERVAELRACLSDGNKDGEAVTRLESAARKIVKMVGEFDAAVSKASESGRGALAAAVPVVPEVPPVLASQIVEIRPAARASDFPFEPPLSESPPASHGSLAPETASAPEAAPRKRGPRKASPAAEASPPPVHVLEAPLTEAPPAAVPSEPAKAPVSADGVTRLVITAYIGIGNRLFIRGEGPGLSWEKGVPLTFVSIGKWRWETSDAISPVRFRLYKNDEVECTALGERSVERGTQQDFTASF
jgi:hypothetical protein